MSLAGLSAERLFELGGLKRQCSERLRCVAHGLAIPCDLCELEGESSRGVVCESCGHHFEQGLLVVDSRSCQSAAEFALSGRIAFESEANAALRRLEADAQRREQAEREAAEQARLSRLRAERERTRREEAERAERERLAREQEEAEAREREEREARERLAREREAAAEHERQERERRELRERAERERVEAEALSRRRSSRALWASALSTALGASLIWSMPFVNPPKTTGYLIGFAAATLLVWAFSVALLYGNERPPAMRAMAPIAWGVTTFVWPGLVGLLLCLLVAKAGFTLKFAGAALVVGVFVLPVAVITCMHVGAALSMRPPWIKGIDADFRGMRSPWVWLGLALTILLNVGLARGKVNDFEGWFVSEESQSAPSRPSVVQGPFRTPEAASEGQGSRAVSQPVPSAAGYVTDVTGAVPADEVAYLAARLEILAKAGVATRVLVVSSTASEDIESFARRVGNTWNEQSAASRSDLLVVVATADRRVRVEVTRDFNDRFTDADAAGLIDLGFRPEAGKAGVGAGLRTLVDRLERTIAARETATASDEDLRARALAAVAMTVAGVGTWDGRQPTLAPAAQAMLDSAKARLEAMPRPARGDRKAARQLHAGGLTLLRASGFEALAVEKLRRAAAADPLDVQILNDLAYAEHRAGEHRAALEHLILTLRLAPDRTSAWVNFAETQTFTTASSEEAVRTASDLYLTGYWFSGDRLKALDYLRERSIAPDASDEVRAAAASTLHRLGSVQDNAASGPGTSTSPSEPRTHEAPLGDTQDQTRQGANSITGRRVINEPRPTGGHKAGEVDTGEQAKAELAPRLSLDVEQRVTRDTAFAKAAEAVKVVADMVIESMQSDTGTLLSSGQLLRDPRILEAIRTRDAAVASVSRDPQTSFTALTKARDLAAQHGSSQQVLQLLEHAVEGDPFNVATLDSVSLILWRIGKLQNAADVAAWRYSIDPLQPAALIRWMEVASISGEMPTDKAGALMAWAYALSGQDPLVRDRLKEIGDSGAKEGTAAEAARLAVAIIYSWEMQGRSRAGSRRQS